VTSAAIGVDPLLFDVPGGVGTYIRNLVPAVAARDPSLDLTLFHASFDRRLDEPWLDGMRVVSVPGSIRTLYPLWNTVRSPALPGPLASADVLHATSGVAIPPATRSQRVIVTIHDLAFLRYPELFPRRWRMLYRLGLGVAARRADAILTPSRSTADDVVARGGVDPARVHVTPLAATLPTGAAEPARVLERLGVATPYLLFVGTIEPRKNLVTLVRAYRRAAAGIPHALVLAGPPGWDLEPLSRELAAPGPGRIVRTGRLSDAELDAVYRGASAFVYPSLYEGFGLPVLEAMVRGIPTIASNVSSLPEVTEDAALLVDPRSPEALGGAIATVLGDDALASRLGEDGRRRAERFTWDETARLTLEAYERSAGRSS
jgi:glycosyltransferase involved in cell wall biosynthesis